MRILSLMVCLLLLGWSPLSAQPPMEGSVTGTGSVEVKRTPELLRVQVEVLGKGKTLKEALAKLKERKESAVAQLVALGVARDSVTFADVSVTQEKNDRQVQIERMLRGRLKAAGKKAPAAEPAVAPILVAALLKVDLPLKATAPEELLQAVLDLQEKIKAADLSGIKEIEKSSPQEEEIAEEMEAFRGGEQGPKRGEPVFLYVAKVSEAERAKALAEAYHKSRNDAVRTAQAAGMDLGPLQHLAASHAATSTDSDDPYIMRLSPWARERSGLGDEWNGEVVGTQPGKVTLRLQVTTSFSLKPASNR